MVVPAILEVVVAMLEEVEVVAVPGAPLVHYCTRVGFVQGHRTSDLHTFHLEFLSLISHKQVTQYPCLKLS